MSGKSLSEKWAAAKSDYDAAAKENAKAREAVQKQLDKLIKEGEKEHKKSKAKEKFVALLRDPVLVRMKAPELKPVIDKIRAKEKELAAIKPVEPRKSVGCTPAFKDVDKVLEVGARLMEAKIDSADKWKSWHKAAVASLKKCADAEKKFQKWLGNPDRDNQPAQDFKSDFSDIMSKMQRQGTPILRHAGTILKAD